MGLEKNLPALSKSLPVGETLTVRFLKALPTGEGWVGLSFAP
jgi:hypothetical protein